ncbi:MAG TPA: DUF1810 domain-containing protein [Burkholderiaceae bacterium]|nr:DUF1810 domain-containing protein [Burkholderiaceae bacterium]
MSNESRYDLERFVQAQRPVFEKVCAELVAGQKRTHWMWFIFPQLKALGRSGTARHFGLENRDEAAAYFDHELLGPRLTRCCDLVMEVKGKSVHDIFGTPDDLKLRSCMTLFEAVAPHAGVFAQILDRHYAGERDELTLRLLDSDRR